MDSKIAEAFVEIRADLDELRKGLDRSLKLTEEHQKATQRMLDRTRQMWRTAYAAISAYMVGTLAKSVIQTAASFEKYEAALSTVLGSAAKAKQAMAWITDFTAKTPFELQQVTDAFSKLASRGFDATKLLGTLGDTAAAMGKTLDQAVEAFTDAATGEFERLKEFGIKASVSGDQVAFRFMDASGKMREVVVENNQAIIASTLEAIWNERYAGGMRKFSETLVGKWSNIKDTITQFMKDIADAGFGDMLKGMLADFLEEVEKLRKSGALQLFAEDLSNLFMGLAEAVGLFVSSVLDAINAFRRLHAEVKARFGGFMTGGELAMPEFDVGDVNDVMEEMTQKMKEGREELEKLPELGHFLTTFSQKIEELKGKLSELRKRRTLISSIYGTGVGAPIESFGTAEPTTTPGGGTGPALTEAEKDRLERERFKAKVAQIYGPDGMAAPIEEFKGYISDTLDDLSEASSFFADEFSSTISSSLTNLIVDTKNATSIIKSLWRKMLEDIIGSLARKGVSNLLGSILEFIPGMGAMAELGATAGSATSAAMVFGLQHGGIVTQPTFAMVAEKGPEAVIPLDKLENLSGPTINIFGDVKTRASEEELLTEIDAALRRARSR